MQLDAQHTLLAYVRTRLVRRADPAAVTATTPLFEDGVIDSINVLDLIGYVEHRLGRRLEDDEIVLAHFRTIETITEVFLS